MLNQEHSIPCPVCQTKIPIDIKQLLMGAEFTCPFCFAAIGTSQETKSIAEEAIEKLDSVKKKIKNKK